jgi:hypothetical protein
VDTLAVFAGFRVTLAPKVPTAASLISASLITLASCAATLRDTVALRLIAALGTVFFVPTTNAVYQTVTPIRVIRTTAVAATLMTAIYVNRIIELLLAASVGISIESLWPRY